MLHIVVHTASRFTGVWLKCFTNNCEIVLDSLDGCSRQNRIENTIHKTQKIIKFILDIVQPGCFALGEIVKKTQAEHEFFEYTILTVNSNAKLNFSL